MSELVVVRITKTVSTTRYGNLSSGDTLRTDSEFARHIVEQCKAGEYAQARQAAEPKRARGKKK